MMPNKHTIHACMDGDVPRMLEVLEAKGIDTTKCIICGEEISSTEVPAYYLMDRIRRWFGSKKRFYTWNIGAFVADGVVCDKIGCFSEMLYRDRMSRR